MNNKIKELAGQALDQAVPGTWTTLTAYDLNQFTGVFAELIVKECIDCALGAGLADDVAVRNSLGFNDGISEAVTHMKKHFGM